MPMKKSVDETFFDVWTPASAYILGLLVSDGTLTTNPRGSRYVEFISTDKELMDIFVCFRRKVACTKERVVSGPPEELG